MHFEFAGTCIKYGVGWITRHTAAGHAAAAQINFNSSTTFFTQYIASSIAPLPAMPMMSAQSLVTFLTWFQ
jgi:hypothetical protein